MESNITKTDQSGEQATVITFVSQKGGVGKSTLCSLFACYETERQRKVLILDGDKQRTICKRRNAAQQIDKNSERYSSACKVKALNLQDSLASIQHKIDEELPFYDLILIDTRCGLPTDILAAVIGRSNFLVLPFNHQEAVLQSTFGWLIDFARLDKASSFKISANCKLILMPSNVDISWGTKEEKALWTNTIAGFRKMYGHVTPYIYHYKAISLFDTLGLSAEQRKMTLPAFDYINHEVFGDNSEYDETNEAPDTFIEK